MSIEIMSLAWKTPCDSHTQKLVLVALADNANDQRVCWPSLDYLAKKCDLSRQSVITQIDKLIECGKLRVRKADGRVNVYDVLPLNPSTALTGQSPIPVNAVDPHPSTALTGPVNGVDPNRNEPSDEPSKGTRFQKPTLPEVTEKMVAMGLPAGEATKFIAHYDSNGWKVGRNAMKSWAAAVVTWRGRYEDRHGPVTPPENRKKQSGAEDL